MVGRSYEVEQVGVHRYPGLVDQRRATVGEVTIPQAVKQELQFVRLPDVVLVAEGDQGRARVTEEGEERLLLAGIPQPAPGAESRISRRMRANDAPGIVRRPVVADQELVVFTRRSSRRYQRSNTAASRSKALSNAANAFAPAGVITSR